MKPTIVAIIFVSLIVVGGIIYAMSTEQPVDAESDAVHTFTVDVPMERARKILVRTNAVKQIVAIAKAKVVAQEWNDFKFDIERPLLKRNWDLKGQGELTVEIDESYLGKHELVLKQDVAIQRELLVSRSGLKEPVGPIRDYRYKLTLSDDESGKAKFDLRLNFAISTTANALTKLTVESAIKASAKNSLEEQEAAIRQMIQDHAGETFILPSGQ